MLRIEVSGCITVRCFENVFFYTLELELINFCWKERIVIAKVILKIIELSSRMTKYIREISSPLLYNYLVILYVKRYLKMTTLTP